jgi:DNA polymerase
VTDAIDPTSLSTRDLREWLAGWQLAGATQLPHVELPEIEEPSGPPPVSEHRGEVPEAAARPESPPVNPSEPRTVADQQTALESLAKQVAQCTRCRELAETRTQTVFGVGNPDADIMFIGEAPGADEDKQGEPFVGRAGQLMNKIIEACGMQREEIYICNILRCRPPGNRNPTTDEADNCREFLDAQIEIVNPDYIVCWGSVAAKNLLGTETPIGKMRGSFYEYAGAKVLCTYHPSYLLRNPAAKKFVWDDMKFLFADLGIEL